MITNILQGLLLGVSTGAFCLGVCMPALFPYAVASEDCSIKASARLTLEFLCGRMTAYLLMGISAFFLGIRLRTWQGMPIVSGIAMALLALLLLREGARRNLGKPRGCAALPNGRLAAQVPFLSGLLLGLSPCPALMIAFSALLVEGRFLCGAIFLTAFFLGTTIWFLPILSIGPLSQRPVFRKVAEISILLSGIWFLAQGLWRIFLCLRIQCF